MSEITPGSIMADYLGSTCRVRGRITWYTRGGVEEQPSYIYRAAGQEVWNSVAAFVRDLKSYNKNQRFEQVDEHQMVWLCYDGQRLNCRVNIEYCSE